MAAARPRRATSPSGAGWSEDRLHRWLASQGAPRGLVGSPGHDAAVLAGLADGHPVICVDQCIEGVHFDAGTTASDIGRKAAHRALSDLAATAARPVGLVLALSAPRECPEAHLRGVLRAVRRAARAVGADLVGGDLAATPGPLCLSVTALGCFDPSASRGTGATRASRGTLRAPGRDRVRVGQAVLLTGPVGGSRARRHLRFLPRLALGRALHEAGATALMDVSDGLAWDLHRLARASAVVIELDLAAVPIHRDARRAAALDAAAAKGLAAQGLVEGLALEHALYDGEDHELLATLPPRAVTAFCVGPQSFTSLARPTGATHDELAWTSRGARPTRIARVIGHARSTRGPFLWLCGEGSRTPFDPADGGYRHGVDSSRPIRPSSASSA